MNVINATILRNNLADAMNEVESKEFILVAKKGKITSALVNIDLFENLLALADKKYLAGIKKSREEYKNGDVFTHEEAFGEV